MLEWQSTFESVKRVFDVSSFCGPCHAADGLAHVSSRSEALHKNKNTVVPVQVNIGIQSTLVNAHEKKQCLEVAGGHPEQYHSLVFCCLRCRVLSLGLLQLTFSVSDLKLAE